MNINYDDVLATVLSIITRLLTQDSGINADTALQTDFGMTSLEVMQLVLDIEDEFDISFPLNRLPDIQTARDLTQEIVTLLDR